MDFDGASTAPLTGEAPSKAAPQHCARQYRWRWVLSGFLLAATCAVGIAFILHAMRSPAHFPSRGFGRSIPTWYTYPPPTDSFPSSPLYSVSLSFYYANGSSPANGTALPSHTYFNSEAHRNMYPGAKPPTAKPGQSVSWTSFAFDGQDIASVLVNVSTTFPIGSCILRPLSYGLTCNSVRGSTTASFLLPRTMLKLSVELLSPAVGNTPTFIAQPLFVFADPPEDPSTVPSPTQPGVLYFARGVHNLTGQVSIPCGTNNVYLEPGAYVSGGFITTCGGSFFSAPEAVMFSGRGVITGENFEWHSPLFTWALINMDRGVGNTVDGLVLVDSPMFHIASYTKSPTVRNVKMFASWPYNSDGFDCGDDGLAEDLFIQSNDDSIKISGGSDSLVQRVVVWQRINGAPVQMGWVTSLSWSNVVVREVDVIHVDYCSGRGDGQCSAYDAIILLSPDGSVNFSLSNITIENMRVEVDGLRLLSITAPAGSSGYFKGLTLRNISVAALGYQEGSTNYVGSLSPSTSISGVQFINVTVGGACLGNAAAAHLTTAGQVSGTTFSCPDRA